LDTICTITIFGLDNSGSRYDSFDEGTLENHIDGIITNAFKWISYYEDMFSSTVTGSDVDRINKAKGEPVKVTEDTINVIKVALKYAEASEGLFDISCGTETELWDFRGESDEPVIPDEKVMAEAVKHVNYDNIAYNEEESLVWLLDPEAKLDLGGIAKGYIAGRIAVLLEDCHVKSAVVDLGGNIVLVNGKSDRVKVDVEHEGLDFDDFVVGVKDPENTESILGTLSLSGKTLVTSGTYERSFTVDGVTYHHILDPKTGFPIDTDLLQVTIIANRSMTTDADALSTTCLQLGLEKGMDLISKIDGVDAIFVDQKGKIHYSNKEMKLKK